MHSLRVNATVVKVYHHRTYDQIKRRPHICAYGGGLWAVYYLRGQQSRMRCNLYTTLAEAIKQATSVSRYNRSR